MLRDVFAFFSGYRYFKIKPEQRSIAADTVYRYGIRICDSRLENDGTYRLKVPLYTAGKASRIFEAEGIEYERSDVNGIPFYLRLFFKRPGLGVGLLIFFTVMWVSGKTVWMIGVEGNEKYSDEFIVGQLEQLGFGYGTYIPSVDFDQMHSEYLAKFSEISWISVNMNGTYANVQVREKRLGDSKEHDDGLYANIVATEDGVIDHEETSAGVALIKQGDVVRKGELLVSGVVPLRNGGHRYTYAESKVYARVPRTIEVEIPLKTTEKVYTGESFTKKTVKIFKKSINLSINSGFEYTTYDKIVRSRRISVFGDVPLPVAVEETEYKEYCYAEKTLTKDEAVSAALAELRDRLDVILADSEITSSRFAYEIDENKFIIKCDLTCITDIANTVEFTADISDTDETDLEN